ncbi:MAG: FtsH protease activity modulator HflK [Proteobacteria bacterium]|nr:FtsH protease activity modulator HflK [Pseudomonadota bacterium]MBU1688029.1 FtsH protease activity modulator HflK [Pseudomonadota bacterium]
MSWEDQQPPWGKKKGPPTPEELIAALITKIKDFLGGSEPTGDSGGGDSAPIGKSNGSGGIGKIALVIGVIVVISVLNSAYYTIKPGEQGVVLRFGKYAHTSGPGLNFKIPMVDQVLKVDVKTVRKEEFGFRTKVAGQRTQYEKRGFDDESLMLTGDKNVIDVEWIVQYKIKDPEQYLFKVGNVLQAVRDIAEKTTRQIVGNMDFDYVLGNRELLAATSSREMQRILDEYESGVDIVKVQLQDVNPPEAVKPAFNEVNEADQDMKRLVNEAEETYNREVPKARGTAKRIVEEAHGYAVQRVNKAKGETARFVTIYKEYERAKEVTATRMYLEMMQDILPKVTDVYVIDKDQQGILPFLNLSEKKK